MLSCQIILSESNHRMLEQFEIDFAALFSSAKSLWIALILLKIKVTNGVQIILWIFQDIVRYSMELFFSVFLNKILIPIHAKFLISYIFSTQFVRCTPLIAIMPAICTLYTEVLCVFFYFSMSLVQQWINVSIVVIFCHKRKFEWLRT